MKKKIRVAAIIETPQGVLLVQDAKDKYRDNTLRELGLLAAKAGAENNYSLLRRLEYAMEIVRDGRYSLPGGKIEPQDYLNVDAGEILELERPLSGREEIEMYLRVIKEAVSREVDEELGLGIDNETLQPILEIQGRERDHIICIAHAEGRIVLNQEELSGIGFLDKPSALPLNKRFFQSHVVKLFELYIKAPMRARFFAQNYLSRINVPESIVEEWYMDMLRGYQGRSRKVKKRLAKPVPLSSSPNFMIFDADGKMVDPLRLGSFTNTQKALIVPSLKKKEKKNRLSGKKKEKTAMSSSVKRHSEKPKNPGISMNEHGLNSLEADLPSLAYAIAASISSTMKKESVPPVCNNDEPFVAAESEFDPEKECSAEFTGEPEEDQK